MFNKCDITLNLYDEEEFLEHGEDINFDIELPKGLINLNLV